MTFRERTLEEIAALICGDFEAKETYFPYRSSSYLDRFFRDADTNYSHDGSTRWRWVSTTLKEILKSPSSHPNMPPDEFCRVITTLMDKEDARNDGSDRPAALALLNKSLKREGYEAFYAEDNKCYLKHIATSKVSTSTVNPHRPFSQAEIKRIEKLQMYLDKASEDDFIVEILLPLFRQLGYLRITSAGHKDKALEYGKDIWMKFPLPTQHMLYFGIQVKIGKLDAAGISKAGNANIAEIYNQVLMMIGHEIFDPEISKNVLVDHAYIVSAGEITKAARNWLGGKLDATKRNQIIFMDRSDVLNLFTVTNIPIPGNDSQPPTKSWMDDPLPF